jgi:hypothetical protein
VDGVPVTEPVRVTYTVYRADGSVMTFVFPGTLPVGPGGTFDRTFVLPNTASSVAVTVSPPNGSRPVTVVAAGLVSGENRDVLFAIDDRPILLDVSGRLQIAGVPVSGARLQVVPFDASGAALPIVTNFADVTTSVDGDYATTFRLPAGTDSATVSTCLYSLFYCTTFEQTMPIEAGTVNVMTLDTDASILAVTGTVVDGGRPIEGLEELQIIVSVATPTGTTNWGHSVSVGPDGTFMLETYVDQAATEVRLSTTVSGFERSLTIATPSPAQYPVVWDIDIADDRLPPKEVVVYATITDQGVPVLDMAGTVTVTAYGFQAVNYANNPPYATLATPSFPFAGNHAGGILAYGVSVPGETSLVTVVIVMEAGQTITRSFFVNAEAVQFLNFSFDIGNPILVYEGVVEPEQGTPCQVTTFLQQLTAYAFAAEPVPTPAGEPLTWPGVTTVGPLLVVPDPVTRAYRIEFSFPAGTTWAAFRRDQGSIYSGVGDFNTSTSWSFPIGAPGVYVTVGWDLHTHCPYVAP